MGIGDSSIEARICFYESFISCSPAKIESEHYSPGQHFISTAIIEKSSENDCRIHTYFGRKGLTVLSNHDICFNSTIENLRTNDNLPKILKINDCKKHQQFIH